MKIKTLIVDDEPIARDRVRRMLREEGDIEIIGESGNGAETVVFINEHAPDLVFLDIQMPEMNGFEVLESIDSEKIPAVIFVTAFDQYAIHAFDVHALDYLLKPFTHRRFRQAVARVRDQFESAKFGKIDERLVSLLSDLKTNKKYLERLVVKSAGRIFFLRIDEIDWIEAAGNYAKLHVGREGHMIRETMNGLEAKLNPEKFLRIHRSTLVNIDRIKELHPLFSGDYSVMLKNGTELNLSRNYRDRLLELFQKSS